MLGFFSSQIGLTTLLTVEEVVDTNSIVPDESVIMMVHFLSFAGGIKRQGKAVTNTLLFQSFCI